jgi:hypothetical protein
MRFGGHDPIKLAERGAGRAHEEPVARAAALKCIEDLVPDRFSFVDQARSSPPMRAESGSVPVKRRIGF